MSSNLLYIKFPPVPPLQFSRSRHETPNFIFIKFRYPNINNFNKGRMPLLHRASAVPSFRGAVSEAMNLMQSAQPTWQSALLSNIVIFILGSPILVTGLSLSGIAAAFLLGTLTWRAFGSSGFLLVATYFVIVSLYCHFVYSYRFDYAIASNTVLGKDLLFFVYFDLFIYGLIR